VRKFKPDLVPDEQITALLEAARLAPSGCNAQPWRFKIVKEPEVKNKLAEAAFDQSFIAKAPVVIVCCADIRGYIDGTVSGIQDLGNIGAVETRIASMLKNSAETLRSAAKEEIAPRIAANVAIAIEHMVLRAMDFGLGSCWIRFVDGARLNKLFGWNDNIYVVALLPLGYPDECPAPTKRLAIKDIIIE
jgi:nitroreductase